MKTAKSIVLVALSALILGSLCAWSAASPFVGSRSEPHAVLYLDVNQGARQIWPVRIWAVDGKLTDRSNQGVLWIKPGDYTFNLKLGAVNIADVSGLQRDARYGRETHELKIRVEAGKAYYLGAKFKASGKWQPEVWKTEKSKY
jgi:hypothetical protein